MRPQLQVRGEDDHRQFDPLRPLYRNGRTTRPPSWSSSSRMGGLSARAEMSLVSRPPASRTRSAVFKPLWLALAKYAASEDPEVQRRAVEFFQGEYELDAYIAKMTTPVVCFLDGITSKRPDLGAFLSKPLRAPSCLSGRWPRSFGPHAVPSRDGENPGRDARGKLLTRHGEQTAGADQRDLCRPRSASFPMSGHRSSSRVWTVSSAPTSVSRARTWWDGAHSEFRMLVLALPQVSQQCA